MHYLSTHFVTNHLQNLHTFIMTCNYNRKCRDCRKCIEEKRCQYKHYIIQEKYGTSFLLRYGNEEKTELLLVLFKIRSNQATMKVKMLKILQNISGG